MNYCWVIIIAGGQCNDKSCSVELNRNIIEVDHASEIKYGKVPSKKTTLSKTPIQIATFNKQCALQILKLLADILQQTYGEDDVLQLM